MEENEDLKEEQISKKDQKKINKTKNSDNLISEVVSNVDFKLVCELGNLNLSIAELIQLKEEQILNFNNNLQQIKVKVNNLTIGFGEIVEIEGKYGVKLTKILSLIDKLQN